MRVAFWIVVLCFSWVDPSSSWVPVQKSRHLLSSRYIHHSVSPPTCRLGVNQRSRPSSEETVKERISFPWGNGKNGFDAEAKQGKNQTDPLNNEVDAADDADSMSPELMAAGALAASVTIVAGLSAASNFDVSASEVVDMVQSAIQNPSAALDQVVQMVESMGPLGAAYFGVAYTIAEVLAIPAIPLTASAGYLFGPVEGTAVVLLSASIAAAISFVIGRTLLRDYVENVLEDYPKFAKIDRAIGKQGFKLMLLLRLSPIFPFALSNYLYGASSINFPAFFWGTLLGFAPGTVAYVCTGAFGKALSDGGESAYPWYVYAGGLTLLGGFLKVLADTATRIVEEIEEEESDSI